MLLCSSLAGIRYRVVVSALRRRAWLLPGEHDLALATAEQTKCFWQFALAWSREARVRLKESGWAVNDESGEPEP